MRQVPLNLVPPQAPSFDNFVAGANAAVVAQLREWTQARTPVFLWGESGCGKSHLLAALAAEVMRAARGARCRVLRIDPRADGPWEIDEATALVVLDEADQLSGDQQHRAFALLVQAQAHGVAWAAAAHCPPVDLPLREDLRSRLAWGLVFALQPLPESQTREVLQGEAARRGIRLSEDLLDHLMHRHARDLGFLMRLFEELDAYALSQSRPVTVPLLRRMLAQAGDLAAMAPSSRLHLVE
jgi:DnaA family protein